MKNFVFLGDSITDAGRLWLPEYNGLGNGYVKILSEKLSDKFSVINKGHGSFTLPFLLRNLTTDCLSLSPAAVSILIGINDVWRQFDSPSQPELHVPPEEYRATYQRLLEQTLPTVKGMVLLTPYFMEPNQADPMRARMDEYGQIVKELAAQYGLPCVDTQAAWDGLFQHMHPCNIAWDRIHPNQVGCMFLAKTFLKAVGFDR